LAWDSLSRPRLARWTATTELLAESEAPESAFPAQAHETVTDISRNDRAVVLMTHADMFDPRLLTVVGPGPRQKAPKENGQRSGAHRPA
jgi:hypothetical protein